MNGCLFALADGWRKFWAHVTPAQSGACPRSARFLADGITTGLLRSATTMSKAGQGPSCPARIGKPDFRT